MSRALSRLQAILLGIAVCLGLGLATLGIFAVGSRQWLWSDVFYLQAGFRQIQGVEAGTRVRVQGIDAGEVEPIQPPAVPGGDVVLRFRIDGRFRHLIRTDASVQIVSEGMLGGRVVEIHPGSPDANPVRDNAVLATRPTTELADVLNDVGQTLQGIRNGEGTLGKLAKDPQAYAALVDLLKQSQETMASIQQDAEAMKRLPVIRGYVEDAPALLVRPNCERNRQYFKESDLFEPGRAVLTAQGRQRLDDLAPWLTGLKHKGSDVVVVAFADPKTTDTGLARTLTQQQSTAVCNYLKDQHGAHKMGWLSSRKVTPLGMGTNPSPVREKEMLPSARVEVLVFVPQGQS